MAVSSSRGSRGGRALRPEAPAREIAGTARVGRRTKLLVRRLRAGDVAIVDHPDLDRVSAEELVSSGVRAVVNASRSSSGSYPNMGPVLLVQAGVHLLDIPDRSLLDRVKDGDPVVVRGGELLCRGEVLGRGEVQDPARVLERTEERRREIGEALEAFAHNTIEHMRDERELLAGRLEIPRFDTDFRDHAVLIVVRGVHHREDLKALKPYIRDTRPVIVAVDGGADAVLEDGTCPRMIVGDMASASERALACGAELVVHAYPDGRAPGRERLDALGLAYKVVPAPATSEDGARLIAAEKGAALIVAVGSHFNLVEFLDKARAGMSSTFLTRLRVGEILVDAKGVSRLYRPSPGRGPMVVVTLAALFVLVVVLVTSPTLGPFLDLVWLKLQILLGLK